MRDRLDSNFSVRNLDILQLLRRLVPPVLVWVSYRLIKLYKDISGRWPTHTTFNKCLFLFYRHLKELAEKHKVDVNDIQLVFDNVYAGPYLKKPPLDCLIALLEREGYIETILQARPYIGDREPISEYFIKLEEVSDNIEEYPKYRKYFIELKSDREPEFPNNIDSKKLELILKAIENVREDLEEIKKHYGDIEEKYVNMYVYKLLKERS
ncbi:MAG: hypothetical protein GXO23_02100 [Crenarchaeota archaeon]|nr:hypothetical protein [Thermoproteota archaeon]